MILELTRLAFHLYSSLRRYMVEAATRTSPSRWTNVATSTSPTRWTWETKSKSHTRAYSSLPNDDVDDYFEAEVGSINVMIDSLAEKTGADQNIACLQGVGQKEVSLNVELNNNQHYSTTIS